MPRLELRESFFGGGLVGEVEATPSLSWSEHQALMTTADAAAATAREAARVSRSLDSLEAELGLQLEDQTRVMSRQLDVLADIAASLKTPAKTRAAERIVDTGELLRRRRFDRALQVAEEAIDADPNNPAAFLAAGWALLGLGRLEEAREQFSEAAAASDGDARSSNNRKVARLTFVLEGPEAALASLRRSATDFVSQRESHAVTYDRVVYETAAGRGADQTSAIVRLGQQDGRYCACALSDPILSRHPGVHAAATSQLGRTIAELDVARARFKEALGHLERQATDAMARSHALGRAPGQVVMDALAAASSPTTKEQFENAASNLRPHDANSVINRLVERIQSLSAPVHEIQQLELTRYLETEARRFASEQRADMIEKRGDVWVVGKSAGLLTAPKVWIARLVGWQVVIEAA